MARVMGVQVQSGRPITIQVVTFVGFGVVRTVGRDIYPVVVGK